jgi:hypothetical protein
VSWLDAVTTAVVSDVVDGERIPGLLAGVEPREWTVLIVAAVEGRDGTEKVA